MSDPIPFTRTQRLGAGAAGEVWLAEGELGTVALKIAASGRSLAAEIGALARLKHPAVPGLVAADRHGGWFARRYVEGARLTSWAHGRPLAERIATFLELAEAVHAIHAAGVIHGDLSPANVLVTQQGAPAVVDVGADVRGGALGWMAPERLRGEAASVRADVYSLGALLYALVAGRPPYDRTGGAALGYAAGASLPLPPATLVPELPAGVGEAALAALAWTAAARPGTAGELAEWVRGALNDPPGPCVLGMLEERERLRRAVVDALRGESSVVVVHGPAGSGRRTLVEEAAAAARREGLRVREVPLGVARAELVVARGEEVLVIDADGLGREAFAELVPATTEAGLVLVRASVPLGGGTRTQVLHIRPVPLSRVELGVLAQVLGVGADRVQRSFERSQGRPGVAVALLHGLVLAGPPLDPVQEALVARLEEGGGGLGELAGLVGLTEHAVLDRLEPLFARGMVWSTPEGDRLYAARLG